MNLINIELGKKKDLKIEKEDSLHKIVVNYHTSEVLSALKCVCAPSWFCSCKTSQWVEGGET